MLTLLSTSAARAGSWQFTCTGSGSNTIAHAGRGPTPTPWTPPGPETGRFGISQFGGGSDYAASSNTTITLTVIATWTHGAGQDDTNDPAPPTVWLCESASADWTMGSSGSASDGFGDAAVPHADGTGGTSFTSPGNSLPPAHWTKCTVSGGIAKLPTRTLSAEGDFTPTQSMPYGDNCYAFVEGYNVTVHAQPYNWHITQAIANWNGYDNPAHQQDGALYFEYDWSSTSGNKDNITDCFWHEFVTYPDPQTDPYRPPSPFTPQSYNNPTITPGQGSFGGSFVSGHISSDSQLVWPSASPYSLANQPDISAYQQFEFDDVVTGETDILIPSSDGSSAVTIERKITFSGNTWNYYCIKSGIVGSKTLQTGL